ncbi:RING-H2 finger protein ATL63 [Raphanus sativus]|uniref:RING-type E3 ubiquitin transferase n=1 Tax=Raphanus sativus TaxID=3726 RepID=A0A6J0L274_RAPSA|nr:RING-H2 finger protein ATL63 [Raphanus sativus]
MREEGSMTTRNSLLKTLSSYNSNVLLAALLFLLLVVLFVLLLHFYARFYWSNSDHEFFAARRRLRRRRIRRRTVTTTRIIPPLPLRGVVDDAEASVATTSDDKGLDPSVISSIPLFVFEDDEKEEEEEEECVICLGLWEAGDFGRKLRFCGHGFHVECIDMWLSSHSSCPLCRSPVLAAVSDRENLKPDINDDVDVVEGEEEEAEEDENVVAGDRRISLSLDVTEDNAKTGVDDDGVGVGEGEVRIEVLDEDGGSRGYRRSTSSASSSLMRMLSSRTRSEGSKVFPSSATQDSSQ